jgi:hypothetical protein
MRFSLDFLRQYWPAGTTVDSVSVSLLMLNVLLSFLMSDVKCVV